MIGATFVSSRVQSAASWSKRPPSSCCRWRLPDVPSRRKPVLPPIQPSGPHDTPGMAPAARIPTIRSERQKPRRPREPQPGPCQPRTASIRTRTRSSASGWSSATAVCTRRRLKTRDWPRPPIKPGASSQRASPQGPTQYQPPLIEILAGYGEHGREQDSRPRCLIFAQASQPYQACRFASCDARSGCSTELALTCAKGMAALVNNSLISAFLPVLTGRLQSEWTLSASGGSYG